MDKKKSKRRRSSSEDSSSSSSSDSSREKKKLRKLKKKLKKEQKKTEKALKKKLKEEKRKLKKKRRSTSESCSRDATDLGEKEKDNNSADIPLELMEKSKAMAPMTKEEWEKRQSVVRRVLDEESGRYRLSYYSNSQIQFILLIHSLHQIIIYRSSLSCYLFNSGY
ncbi:hypothetical protein ABMA28_001740 [Loxostege sticticalis]|uniref:ADP-ribosylation factor-like protein 6-interacting protein 4 n=1 Tax=Loxostege sticticalis TaxID=481309 RepID=A0ABD0T6V2_LOXSC